MTTDSRWTISDVARHLGIKESSARGQLTRWGVTAKDYQRGPNGRPMALFDAKEVRQAAAARPGRGSRTDLKTVDGSRN